MSSIFGCNKRSVPFYARPQRLADDAGCQSDDALADNTKFGLPASLLPPELSPPRRYSAREQDAALEKQLDDGKLQCGHCCRPILLHCDSADHSRNRQRACMCCLCWYLRVVAYCSEQCQRADFRTHHSAHHKHLVVQRTNVYSGVRRWSDSLDE